MSKMPPQSQKKRKLEDGLRGKTSRPKKRIRKQQDYHSSSDEESDVSGSDAGFAPVNLQDSNDEAVHKNEVKSNLPRKPNKFKSPAEDPSQDEEVSPDSDPDDNDDDDETDPSQNRKSLKRNDPAAFSTSISKILSTKLSQSARSDPLLSRSREAHANTTALKTDKLAARAAAQSRAQRKVDLDKGRITDVLGLERGVAGEVAEEEKRLRKIAQRGVVKLFNAVRAAQVRGEEAEKAEREKGVVRRKEREEKGREMSKQGFLELIAGGPKTKRVGD